MKTTTGILLGLALTLSLNQTQTHAAVYSNAATATVTAGAIFDNDPTNGGYLNLGTVYVLSGEFKFNKGTGVGAGLINIGTAIVTGGTFTSNKTGYMNYVGSTSGFINNGQYTYNTNYGAENYSSLTVAGGSFSFNNVGLRNETNGNVSGTATLIGGTFSNNTAAGIYNDTKMTITFGHVNSNGQYGVLNTGTLTLVGGDFTANSYADLANWPGATINIYAKNCSLGFGTFVGVNNGAIKSMTLTFAHGSTQTLKYMNAGTINVYPLTAYNH